MTTKEKITPFVILIVFFASLSGLLFGYNTAVISGALIFLSKHFSLSMLEEILSVSSILIGAILGVSSGGILADSWGRRKTILITSFLFVIFIWMASVAETLPIFLFGRFFTGVAIGISSVTIPLYLAEIAPAHQRGAIVAIYQLAITVGNLAAYLTNYLFAGANDWRTMIAIGAIPAGIQLIGMFFVPESPSWLLKKRKKALAWNVFEKIREDKGWESHFNEMKECASPQKESGWGQLLNPSLRKVLIIGVGISFFQQITGINTIFYYAPKIFQILGFSSPSEAILPTVGIGVVNLIATLISLPLLDRIGRRKLLIIGLIGMIISLIIMVLGFFTKAHTIDMIAVICILTYVGFFAISQGATTFVIISEIYPLSIRGRAMSIAILANWVGNYLVSASFPSFINYLGAGGSFSLYALISLAALWFVIKFVPETKGKTLEEIEHSIRG